MVESKRLEDDEALKATTAGYEKKKQDVDEAVRRLGKSQDEQNQLNITLRQVEEYNEQMKAEIQVTRRATYKAEDHIKQVEKAKVKQDHLLDSMNEDVKRMTEQKHYWRRSWLLRSRRLKLPPPPCVKPAGCSEAGD